MPSFCFLSISGSRWGRASITTGDRLHLLSLCCPLSFVQLSSPHPAPELWGNLLRSNRDCDSARSMGDLGSQEACASSTARHGETSPCDGPPSPGRLRSKLLLQLTNPASGFSLPEALFTPAVRRPFPNRGCPSTPKQEAVPVAHR